MKFLKWDWSGMLMGFWCMIMGHDLIEHEVRYSFIGRHVPCGCCKKEVFIRAHEFVCK